MMATNGDSLQSLNRNVCGRVTAITVVTPMRPAWVEFARQGFGLVRRFVGPFTATLRQLSFINMAKWSIMEEIPFNGPPQSPEKSRYAYLVFESNFNGTWEDYIDSFSFVLPRRIWLTWSNSYGFPGPQPTGPFKRYIRYNEYEADHYYCAYPEGTTTKIVAALALDASYQRFQAETDDLTPDQFAAAYRRFLAAVQRYL